MKISILIPSRNGVEYLEWCYDSIRKNQGFHYVEILVLDDISDKDNTWEWCEQTMKNDSLFKAYKNETGERYGISSGYKFLSQYATQDVICHWHNDMFMTEGTLDAVEKSLYKEMDCNEMGYGLVECCRHVVCLTRIEPTIYTDGGVYPEKIVWADAPIEVEQWDEQKFLDYLPIANQLWSGKTTEGHFAPFFMFREQYLELGGNDILNFPKQAREDSDWAFRLVLAGFKTVQIPHFVFHFASRGNRRSKHESGNFIDNPEWVKIENQSVRNFIRKWQTFELHDKLLKPTPPSRYNVQFNVTNCSRQLLWDLEPWCDVLNTDLHKDVVLQYIEVEQKNTKFELVYKIDPEIIVPEQDVVVYINGNTLSNEDWYYLTHLSEILTDSGEIGEMGIGNLKLKINALNHYERDLIVCKK